jgi:hypothetical protein
LHVTSNLDFPHRRVQGIDSSIGIEYALRIGGAIERRSLRITAPMARAFVPGSSPAIKPFHDAIDLPPYSRLVPHQQIGGGKFTGAKRFFPEGVSGPSFEAIAVQLLTHISE